MKNLRLIEGNYSTEKKWYIQAKSKSLFCGDKWVIVYGYKSYKKAKKMFDSLTGNLNVRVLEMN